MIESIGYSQDGTVWMRLIMDVNEQRLMGTLMLTPEMADRISTDLKEASGKAKNMMATGVVQ